MIDILDELQEVNSYVKVHLRSGDILYGVPDIVEFDDDEETGEIIKSIHFFAMNKKYAYYLREDEVESYTKCRKEDIPESERSRPPLSGLDYAVIVQWGNDSRQYW